MSPTQEDALVLPPAGTQKRKRTRDGRQKLLNKLAQVRWVPGGRGCWWLPHPELPSFYLGHLALVRPVPLWLLVTCLHQTAAGSRAGSISIFWQTGVFLPFVA